MKKLKFLIVLLLVLFAVPLMGAHLTRQGSHDAVVTRAAETVFWNADTATLTKIICTVSTHVKALHDGEMQGIRYDSTIASGEFYYIKFNAPETAEGDAHLLWSVDGTGEAQLDLYQTTQLSGGAQLTPLNFVLGDPTDGLTETWVNPIVADTDVVLPFGGKLGAGQQQGANFAAGEEVIANSGLTVLFKVSSQAANNDTVIRIWWHITGEGVIP